MIKLSLTIFIAATLFVSCNSSNTKTANAKPLVVASDTASIKYQCPMKDQHDTCYTTAGACPSCGMDLEKVN